MTTSERTAPRGNGGAGRGRPPKVNATECAALYRAGSTISALAERYGVTRGAIQYRLRMSGDLIPGPARPARVETPSAPATGPRWPRPTLDWETRAKCSGIDDTGDDLFHPSIDEKTEHPSRTAAGAYERARAFCRRCPVTIDCLTTALAAETDSTRYGIWGGLSPRQRAAIEPDATRHDLAAAIRHALFPPQAPRGLPRKPSSRTVFTESEMRAANALVDRWRRTGGPAPDGDTIAAYRAYQRQARAARRARQNDQPAPTTPDTDEAIAERRRQLLDATQACTHNLRRLPALDALPDPHDAEEATA